MCHHHPNLQSLNGGWWYLPPYRVFSLVEELSEKAHTKSFICEFFRLYCQSLEFWVTCFAKKILSSSLLFLPTTRLPGAVPQPFYFHFFFYFFFEVVFIFYLFFEVVFIFFYFFLGRLHFFIFFEVVFIFLNFFWGRLHFFWGRLLFFLLLFLRSSSFFIFFWGRLHFFIYFLRSSSFFKKKLEVVFIFFSFFLEVVFFF